MGEQREAWGVLMRTPEGKRPLGRPELRQENIKVDLQEIGWEDVGWIHVIQRRENMAVLSWSR